MRREEAERQRTKGAFGIRNFNLLSPWWRVTFGECAWACFCQMEILCMMGKPYGAGILSGTEVLVGSRLRGHSIFPLKKTSLSPLYHLNKNSAPFAGKSKAVYIFLASSDFIFPQSIPGRKGSLLLVHRSCYSALYVVARCRATSYGEL